jgi:hypothetical protein
MQCVYHMVHKYYYYNYHLASAVVVQAQLIITAPQRVRKSGIKIPNLTGGTKRLFALWKHCVLLIFSRTLGN